MNIFEKMGAITNELGPIAKNLQVGDERKPTSYKAVGEADVLAAVKPLEAKYRIFSYPCSREIVDSDTLTVTKTYNKETTETTKFFLRLKTVYRFIDMDKPDDYIDITAYGDGVDPNDKAPGKAMTYSDKYALLKAYKAVARSKKRFGRCLCIACGTKANNAQTQKSEDENVDNAFRQVMTAEKRELRNILDL